MPILTCRYKILFLYNLRNCFTFQNQRCLIPYGTTTTIRWYNANFQAVQNNFSDYKNELISSHRPEASSLLDFLVKDQKKSGDISLHTKFNLYVDDLLKKSEKGQIKKFINDIKKDLATESQLPLSAPFKDESTRTMTDPQVLAYIHQSMPYQYASLYSVLTDLKIVNSDVSCKSQHILDCGKGPGIGALASYSVFPTPNSVSIVEENPFLKKIIYDIHHNIYPSTSPNPTSPVTLNRLPLGKKDSYTLVIASNKLLEMKSEKELFDYLRSLWSLVSNDGGLLVLCERGTKRGFSLIQRARTFLLQKSKNTSDKQFNAHIVAPCPHDGRCPIDIENGVRANICSFKQHFFLSPFSRLYVPRSHRRSSDRSHYSYVVIQKGITRPLNNTTQRFKNDEDLLENVNVTSPTLKNWPRIIRPPLKRDGHVIIDVCDSDARLRRNIVPKSQGKLAYRLARKSAWGDLFPLEGKVQSTSPSSKITKHLKDASSTYSINPPSYNKPKVERNTTADPIFVGKRFYSTNRHKAFSRFADFNSHRFPCIFTSFSCYNCISGTRKYSRQYSRDKFHYNQRTTIYYLVAISIFALGLTYAAVPLYRLFCSKTGYGGTLNTDQSRMNAERMVPRKDNKRIRVTFNGDVAGNLSWKLWPQQREIYVLPGETALGFYTAENTSDHDIVGVATYNIVPGQAAVYFSKVACFCFEEQKLDAHEKVDLPVFFFIDPEFADDPNMKDIDDILLSYTFFEARYDTNGNLLTKLN
ncbi:Rsm22-cox11 tandem protein 1, mitochondrial [Schizosaccharomyces pombe]|uniref:Rsm22-cox11 tandem fusion protein, mitochondrial n=1 Tax=Schizosaccharomyces pombe (strain 972 / ATCC 24843) TaxID=284812 RepID=CO111_SCHPO|nr:rsm22-cox11 tandem protein cox1101 [Schizosaccharomyces pombe]Q9UTM2.2 RecName: Full=Rsm22-cox11 tandem protein 1, mitochondrial; Contains: RecName: Full=Probable S-adenosyl-L-methionine-dependent RNA methyltransferase Rsm22-1; Contains: RecName: Full=Cytochrome c oxidase assembly protein cox11-1; Flags: Precursor [Schizosaccharomyces pombe 972h-]CAB57323.2 fusion cytochrome c oxidase assembly protein Cox1101, mitochondrial ribosomal protein Rsm22 (predicted) [Schizosaccharomyces pombe]|eukprot:NP_593279.2 rsm22-cox11 tandem protein cox1101 [Schizosaccharomyces pombe]